MIDLQHIDCFDYLKKIPNDSIDCVFIDPPYGVLGKHKIETEIDISKLTKEFARVIKKGGFYIFFGMMPTIIDWYKKAIDNDFKFKQEIIWHKSPSGPNHLILKCHENVYIFTKDIKTAFNDLRINVEDKYNPNSNNATLKRMYNVLSSVIKRCVKSGSIEPILEMVNEKKHIISNKRNDSLYFSYKMTQPINNQYITNIISGSRMESVMYHFPHNKQRFNKSEYNIKHPTVKPIQLVRNILKLTCKENANVLDCFVGSGTTALACKELDLNFFGCELLKEYYDIATKRVKEYTFQKEIF